MRLAAILIAGPCLALAAALPAQNSFDTSYPHIAHAIDKRVVPGAAGRPHDEPVPIHPPVMPARGPKPEGGISVQGLSDIRAGNAKPKYNVAPSKSKLDTIPEEGQRGVSINTKDKDVESYEAGTIGNLQHLAKPNQERLTFRSSSSSKNSETRKGAVSSFTSKAKSILTPKKRRSDGLDPGMTCIGIQSSHENMLQTPFSQTPGMAKFTNVKDGDVIVNDFPYTQVVNGDFAKQPGTFDAPGGVVRGPSYKDSKGKTVNPPAPLRQSWRSSPDGKEDENPQSYVLKVTPPEGEDSRPQSWESSSSHGDPFYLEKYLVDTVPDPPAVQADHLAPGLPKNIYDESRTPGQKGYDQIYEQNAYLKPDQPTNYIPKMDPRNSNYKPGYDQHDAPSPESLMTTGWYFNAQGQRVKQSYPGEITNWIKRDVISEITTHQDSPTSNSDIPKQQIEQYIAYYSSLQQNVSTLIWPTIATMLNAASSDLIYMAALSIFVDLTRANVVTAGPFWRGLNCFDDIEDAAREAGESDEYLSMMYVVDQTAIQIYEGAWANATKALEGTTLVSDMDLLQGYLQPEDESLLPEEWMQVPEWDEAFDVFFPGADTVVDFRMYEYWANGVLGNGTVMGNASVPGNASTGDYDQLVKFDKLYDEKNGTVGANVTRRGLW